ncbi:hypothetical protein HMPREF0105_3982 [Bacteroides sp. 3_1_33FAA]|nr:hypothetical protein HMPREF0105_3982 [Bacteroides sp. 3_1_33FAA]
MQAHSGALVTHLQVCERVTAHVHQRFRVFSTDGEEMATIKFLRDTLNFGDAVIRKLRTFKDVSIKGELYSRELFSRHFKTDGAVCSLKQDTSFSVTITIYLQKLADTIFIPKRAIVIKKRMCQHFDTPPMCICISCISADRVNVSIQ